MSGTGQSVEEWRRNVVKIRQWDAVAAGLSSGDTAKQLNAGRAEASARVPGRRPVAPTAVGAMSTQTARHHAGAPLYPIGAPTATPSIFRMCQIDVDCLVHGVVAVRPELVALRKALQRHLVAEPCGHHVFALRVRCRPDRHYLAVAESRAVHAVCRAQCNARPGRCRRSPRRPSPNGLVPQSNHIAPGSRRGRREQHETKPTMERGNGEEVQGGSGATPRTEIQRSVEHGTAQTLALHQRTKCAAELSMRGQR